MFLFVEGVILVEMIVLGSVWVGVEGYVFFYGGIDCCYWCYEDLVGVVVFGGCIF